MIRWGIIAAVLALSACASGGGGLPTNPFGVLSKNYVQLVQVDDGVVEVDANGRTVRIDAPDGLCIPIDAVQTSRDSVFLIMGDCLFNQDVFGGADTGAGALGGLLSLSIATQPLFEPGVAPDAGARALMAYLKTPAGRESIAQGGVGDQVRLRDLKTVGGTVYALIEDTSAKPLPVSGPLVWRAFAELNQRMTLVSITNFNTGSPPPDFLLAKLAEVVTALKRANNIEVAAAEAALMNPTPVTVQAPVSAPLAEARPERVVRLARK